MNPCYAELLPVTLGELQHWRHSAVSGGYSHREDFLWIGSPTGEADRVVVHEWFHFFEHASTPLGLFRSELHQLQLQRTISFLSAFSEPIFVPVLEWARAFRKAGNLHATVKDSAQFDRLITDFISPWTRCAWLEEVLDGIGPTESKVGTLARAASVLYSVEQLDPPWLELLGIDSGPPFESLALPNVDGEIPLSPIIELKTALESARVPIAGLHLSETMSQILEGVRAGEISRLSVEYSVLLKLTFRCWHELGRPINSSTQRTVAYSCLVLADLSCFTPVGSIYGTLRPAMQEWSDIHPGHRFLQALDVTIGMDSWISTLDEAETLANQICDHLGWVRPRRFLEIGANLGSANSNIAAHRYACRLRSEQYSTFLDTSRWKDSSVVDFIDAHMPMSHTHDGGFVCPVPEDDPSAAVVRLRNYSVARLCWLVMKGSRVIRPSDLLPAEFPYDRHFDPLYASPESFIALLSQTHPWASLSRIHPFGHSF